MWKDIFSKIGVVIFILGLLALSVLRLPKSTIQVEGISISSGAMESDTGPSKFLIVKLESNKNVKVYMPQAAMLLIGKRVLINEQTTYLFDTKKYKFNSYIDTKK